MAVRHLPALRRRHARPRRAPVLQAARGALASARHAPMPRQQRRGAVQEVRCVRHGAHRQA
eukprot:589352-Lingulodinium_polyedra.AAC.1